LPAQREQWLREGNRQSQEGIMTCEEFMAMKGKGHEGLTGSVVLAAYLHVLNCPSCKTQMHQNTAEHGGLDYNDPENQALALKTLGDMITALDDEECQEMLRRHYDGSGTP
jgi:hypothetical protein